MPTLREFATENAQLAADIARDISIPFDSALKVVDMTLSYDLEMQRQQDLAVSDLLTKWINEETPADDE